jgi:hypothetical protein
MSTEGHINKSEKRSGQRARRGQVNTSGINISEGKPGRYVKSKDQSITTEGRSNNHVRSAVQSTSQKRKLRSIGSVDKQR